MHPEARRILESVLHAIEHAAPITLDRAEQYGGAIGDYWIQFEGEDDLLHCVVRRLDNAPLTMQEAHRLVEPFFGVMPKGLVWCKPTETAVHYYVGHDPFWQAHQHGTRSADQGNPDCQTG
ncbi:MAG: hypothetical protein ABDI19_09065 [Armatimonadota bacterium]